MSAGLNGADLNLQAESEQEKEKPSFSLAPENQLLSISVRIKGRRQQRRKRFLLNSIWSGETLQMLTGRLCCPPISSTPRLQPFPFSLPSLCSGTRLILLLCLFCRDSIGVAHRSTQTPPSIAAPHGSFPAKSLCRKISKTPNILMHHGTHFH